MVVTQDCAAGAEAVWAVMTDLDRFAEVTDIVAIQRLDAGTGFDVGTRWRETRRMFGREATEEMWVTELDPGHRYVVLAESHGSSYRSVVTVTPAADGGCTLAMDFDASGTNVVSKVLGATLGRLFERATRGAIAADLANVARAAEADAGIEPVS